MFSATLLEAKAKGRAHEQPQGRPETSGKARKPTEARQHIRALRILQHLEPKEAPPAAEPRAPAGAGSEHLLAKALACYFHAGDLGAHLAPLSRAWRDGYQDGVYLMKRDQAAQFRLPGAPAESPEQLRVAELHRIANRGPYDAVDNMRVLWGPSGRPCIVWTHGRCGTWPDASAWELVVMVPVPWHSAPEVCWTLKPWQGEAPRWEPSWVRSWHRGAVPEKPAALPLPEGEGLACKVVFSMAAAELGRLANGEAERQRVACSGRADWEWLLRHLGLRSSKPLLDQLAPHGDFYWFEPRESSGYEWESDDPSVTQQEPDEVVDALLAQHPYASLIRAHFASQFRDTGRGRMFAFDCAFKQEGSSPSRSGILGFFGLSWGGAGGVRGGELPGAAPATTGCSGTARCKASGKGFGKGAPATPAVWQAADGVQAVSGESWSVRYQAAGPAYDYGERRRLQHDTYLLPRELFASPLLPADLVEV